MCPGTESTQCAKETAERRFQPNRPPMLLLLVESAWACGGSPEMGLCVAALKRPFVMKHFVVLSPTGPEHPSALPQGMGQKN